MLNKSDRIKALMIEESSLGNITGTFAAGNWCVVYWWDMFISA